MDRVVEQAQHALAALPTGRVTPALVETLQVAAWGGRQRLSHIATVTVEQPRTLVIAPHDPAIAGDIERALATASLGSMPSRDGAVVRISIPMPDQQQRTQYEQQARTIAEEARVAVRLVRRDAINTLKRQRAQDEISEAKLRGRSKDIQASTDTAVSRINDLLERTVTALRG